MECDDKKMVNKMKKKDKPMEIKSRFGTVKVVRKSRRKKV